jgi:chitin disaccharide deacetylase
VENKWRIEDVEKEFRAQIEMARRKIPRISHLSGHMGCSMAGPEVRALTQRLGKEYGLQVETIGFEVKSVSYAGPRGSSPEKIASFIKMLESLESEKTYLFVDHPGFDTPELRAIHHIGYENVAVDRQGVTDTYTSPRVREAIEARGIRLIGYRDLPR